MLRLGIPTLLLQDGLTCEFFAHRSCPCALAIARLLLLRSFLRLSIQALLSLAAASGCSFSFQLALYRFFSI
jgi:hypothetical protein